MAGLTLSTAKYKDAISVLRRLFSNEQQIVAKHTDALLNTEPVTSDFNLKALSQQYDIIESQIQGLKALGMASKSYSNLLSSMLPNKLPQEIHLIISRKVGDGHWELDKLTKTLEEEVQAEKELLPATPHHQRSLGDPLNCRYVAGWSQWKKVRPSSAKQAGVVSV